MDTLIIQIGTRPGRLAEIVGCKGDTVMLGRSFANDIVIVDPYVAPEQIKIDKHDNKWVIKILDDTNPVLLNGSPVEDDGVELSSGDKLTIGRTHLSVFSKDHEFESTRKLLFSSWLYHNRLGPLLPVLAVFIASLLSAFDDYLGLSEKIEYRPFISEVLVFVFIISLWAALWALVGRLLRHQLHFFANLLFTAILVSFYIMVAPLGEYVEYLTGNLIFSALFNSLVFLVFLTLVLKFNLSLSTHLKNCGAVAFRASLALLLFSYGVSEFKDDEFSAYAEYANKLKPPFAKLRGDQSVEEYLAGFEDQFFELEDLLEEEEPPFEIKKVLKCKTPLFAVAEGCLNAAELQQ
jgi:hypothetical protein